MWLLHCFVMNSADIVIRNVTISTEKHTQKHKHMHKTSDCAIVARPSFVLFACVCVCLLDGVFRQQVGHWSPIHIFPYAQRDLMAQWAKTDGIHIIISSGWKHSTIVTCASPSWHSVVESRAPLPPCFGVAKHQPTAHSIHTEKERERKRLIRSSEKWHKKKERNDSFFVWLWFSCNCFCWLGLACRFSSPFPLMIMVFRVILLLLTRRICPKVIHSAWKMTISLLRRWFLCSYATTFVSLSVCASKTK